jgi:hypothetical protein
MQQERCLRALSLFAERKHWRVVFDACVLQILLQNQPKFFVGTCSDRYPHEMVQTVNYRTVDEQIELDTVMKTIKRLHPSLIDYTYTRTGVLIVNGEIFDGDVFVTPRVDFNRNTVRLFVVNDC